MPVSMRRRFAVPAAAVVLCATGGCATQNKPATAWVAASAPASASPQPVSAPVTTAPRTGRPTTAAPASPSRSASPTRTASTRKASAPARTSAAARRGVRISNLSLTVPDENGFGKPVRVLHQGGCGSSTNANIWYTVTAPAGRFREAWYEYEVDAPAPIRGRSDFYELVVNGDRASVKTFIEPLPHKAANAAGGKVTITVVVVDNDSGARVTARMSATMLPCD